MTRDTLHVSALFVYPIKSCGALACDALELRPRGPRLDREWMVVDTARSHFLTQRNCPRLALARPSLEGDRLVMRAPHTRTPLALALEPAARGVPREVEVWGDLCVAHDEGDAAAAWFGALLGRDDVRLVRMAPDFVRPVDARYAPPQTPVGFADGFPLLITSAASLAALVAALPEAVPMSRFRPNLVIGGGRAWQEDAWTTLRVGEAGTPLRIVKPCTRCKVITIDQTRAEVPRPGEPLATLGRLRPRPDGRIVFGQNALGVDGATIRRGEHVTAD